MRKYIIVSIFAAAALLASCIEKEEKLHYRDLEPSSIVDSSAVVPPADTTAAGDSTDFIEEPLDPTADPSGIFDYTLLNRNHPRLLMTAEDEEAVREKITAGRFDNPYLYKIHKHIISVADKEVNSSTVISYTLDASGKRLLSQSNATLKRIFYCAYAYRMTGEKKYLDRCTETIDIVCAFPDWHPSHFLDTGEMSLAMAIAYDWLYYALDYDRRVLLHSKLLHYGIEKGQNASYHNTNGNWNSVCNAGITAASIAIYDRDKTSAFNYIQKAITNNKERMKKVYGSYGNYAEGYGYWEYGTTFQVCLMMMLQKAFGSTYGIADLPGLKKTPEFMLFMSSACGGHFSYNDGGSGSETVMSAMWWFAQMQNRPDFLLNELRLFDAGKYNSNEYRLLPLLPVIIKDCNFSITAATKPATEIWAPQAGDLAGANNMPVAMVHTGWNFDEGDCYLGVKAGVSNESHSHLDGGSFVFESQGVRWSTDLQRPNYANAEVEAAASTATGVKKDFWGYQQNALRWNFIRMNNWCHSTLSFENNDGSVANKLHPTDHYSYGKTTLEEVFSDEASLGARVNMTEHLKGQVAKCTRTFRLLDKKDLYVIDEVTALDGQDARMYWRMLTGASVSVENGYLRLSGKSGEKHLYIRTFPNKSSQNVEYHGWDAEHPSDWTIPYTWDSSNSGYSVAGFFAVIPAGSTVKFTTILSADLPDSPGVIPGGDPEAPELDDNGISDLSDGDPTDPFTDLDF